MCVIRWCHATKGVVKVQGSHKHNIRVMFTVFECALVADKFLACLTVKLQFLTSMNGAIAVFLDRSHIMISRNSSCHGHCCCCCYCCYRYRCRFFHLPHMRKTCTKGLTLSVTLCMQLVMQSGAPSPSATSISSVHSAPSSAH